ncbi:MAG: FxSxx-COOH system tetratricopeptide repeat protein [Thermoanaerobaculia bacterium]
MAKFDVFLSHNSRDKAEVKAIGEALKARGLRVWLDEWELRPGLRWQRELESAISRSGSAAVFVGANGLGPWEEPEMEVFLDRALRGSELALIPVLLPNAPENVELRPFLKLFTWVDLRSGVTPEGLGRLVWGITGEKPGLAGGEETPQPPRPPAHHNLPWVSLGEELKGREADLAALAESLEGRGAAGVVAAKAIHGLGGVGKTRLALEYAWRSGHCYTYAFFVPAESPEALQAGLARLGREVLLLPQMDGKPEEAAKQAVVSWLRNHSSWLLILDNVDSEAAQGAVQELLALSTGRVVVTSRLSRWQKGVGAVEVTVLEPEAAVALLLSATEERRRARPEDPDTARELAQELGFLPLALEIAGAYIAAQRLSFQQYLTAWEADRSRVLAWHEPGTVSYPLPLAIVWSQAFRRLEPGARALLRLLSHLAPEPVAVAMLEGGAEILAECVGLLREEEGAPVEPSSQTAHSPREALAELDRYSLVRWPGETTTVHRLVQEVVRAQIPAPHQPAWVERAVRLVNDFAPPDPVDALSWPVWDPLRPHAERVIGLAEAAGVTQPTAMLMNQLGLLLLQKALHRQAEPLLRRALEIAEASDGPGHENTASALTNLAQLLQDTHRLDEAEQLMRRAVEITEASFGPDHPKLALRLNNLAVLLEATNRVQEAERQMRRVVAIFEASLGSDHPYMAIPLNNLAQLLQATNRLGEAEQLMRRVLNIDETRYGPEHPEVARDLNNLADFLRKTQRPEEAEPLLGRALACWRASLGEDHPNVAVALNNLALVFQDTNRLEEAEPMMRRALAIDQASYGPGHPNVARDLNNLATLLHASGRLEEAEALMRRALLLDESNFGQDHPSLAIRLNNLAQLLVETHRLHEAEPLMRRNVLILWLFRHRTGHLHPNLETSLANYRALLAAQGQSPEEVEAAVAAVMAEAEGRG